MLFEMIQYQNKDNTCLLFPFNTSVKKKKAAGVFRYYLETWEFNNK